METGNGRPSLSNNIILSCIKTVSGFIFPLITFPYVTRVLGAENLGKVNFSNSIVTYFGLIAALGVRNYGIREGSAVRDDVPARDRFFNEIFTVNALSALAAYVLLFLTVLVSAKLRNYTALLAVHSLSMFFTWIGIEWVYIVYEDYLQATLRAFAAQLVSLVLMFLFVKTPEDYVTYALITVLANGGSFVFNYFFSAKYYRPRLTADCNLRKHLSPMIVLAAGKVAMAIYISSDSTMLGLLIGDRAVGLYGTATKMYTMVKEVLNAIVASATPRVAYFILNGRDDEYRGVVGGMLRLLLLTGIPAMVGLFLTAGDVVWLMAGAEYAESVPALRVLSVALLFSIIASAAYTYGLVVRRRDKEIFRVSCESALLNIALNFFAIPWLGITGAALTTLISELFVFIVYMKKTGFAEFYGAVRRSLVSCGIGVAVITAVCLLLRPVADPVLRLALSVTVSVSLYGAVLILRKETIVTDKLGAAAKKLRGSLSRRR